MNVILRSSLSSLIATLIFALPLVAETASLPSTVVPVSRASDATWESKHEGNIAKAKTNPDLIFLGDSITDIWDVNGTEAWKKHYGNLKAVQLGISADKTQNILWRVQNGETAHPKVVVLLAGTNNIYENSPVEIAQGVQAIIQEVLKQSPKTKILLMGVFPRGEKVDAGDRPKVAAMNVEIAKLADNKSVTYMDIGKKFLDPDGNMSKDVMIFDFIHPTQKGYEIWADAIQDQLNALMGTSS